MPSKTDIKLICAASHGDPFAVLGPHLQDDGRVSVRAFLPGAVKVHVLSADTGAVLGRLLKRDPSGFFEQSISADTSAPYRLQVQWAEGALSVLEDPYRFGPVIGDMDVWLLSEGTHLRPYEVLGANPGLIDGVAGTVFAVWAPNASRVSVVGDFNYWDGRRFPMRLRRECGVWEIFLPGVAAGALYKFEIRTNNGAVLPGRADPYARQAELRPGTASIVACMPPAQPSTSARRHANALDAPISIYEVHLGSWRRIVDAASGERRWPTWDEVADLLVPYTVDNTMDGVLGCLIGKPGRATAALLLLVNPDDRDCPFALPPGPWQALLDTAHPLGTTEWQGEGHFLLQAHSLVLLTLHSAD